MHYFAKRVANFKGKLNVVNYKGLQKQFFILEFQDPGALIRTT